ncbi:MAG: hypothetical protein LH467_01485 [Gemmatimonadaceae bacterium]|nr:hypothetical protein [Gemmatimonadaceae bacterium]
MRPNTLIIAHFAARGMRLWVVARLLAGAMIALDGGHPLYLDLSSAVLLVVSCIALGLADVRRRHERALLENLGVSPFARASFFACPALVGESAIAVLGSMIE